MESSDVELVLKGIGVFLLLGFSVSLLVRMRAVWAHLLGISGAILCLVIGSLSQIKNFKGKISPTGVETEISTLKNQVVEINSEIDRIKKLTSETTVVALRGIGKLADEDLDKRNTPVGDAILESVYGKENFLGIKKDLVNRKMLWVSKEEKHKLQSIKFSESKSQIGTILDQEKIE